MTALPKFALVLAILAIAAGACSTSSDGGEDSGQAPSSSVKEPAPIFSVDTQDGEFSLSEHIANDGRPVFLNLWASWCFPCREEMPEIDAAAAAHPEVAFIGIAVQDTEAEAQKFAKEIGVSYMLGVDTDDMVNDSYAPLGLPASYIIDGNGVIVERIFGKITEDDLAEKFETHFG